VVLSGSKQHLRDFMIRVQSPPAKATLQTDRLVYYSIFLRYTGQHEGQYSNTTGVYNHKLYPDKPIRFIPEVIMFVWCGILFCLGILAFIDAIMNMGAIFRQINSAVFMLISLALLVRTSTKAREAKRENVQAKIRSLEQQLKTFREGEKVLEDY